MSDFHFRFEMLKIYSKSVESMSAMRRCGFGGTGSDLCLLLRSKRGGPVKSIKNGFKLKAKASGLEGVTPHVLRHTAAVHLAANGVAMSKISQYLGHSSTAVTERVYARFAPDHMREEADILDFASRLKKVV